MPPIVRRTSTTIKANPGFFIIGAKWRDGELEIGLNEPVIAWEIEKIVTYENARDEADGVSEDVTDVIAIGAWGRRNDTFGLAVKGPGGECFDFDDFFEGEDGVSLMMNKWREQRAHDI